VRGGTSGVSAVQLVLNVDGTLSFSFGSYDPSQAITLDPTISYSTYLGGSGTASANGFAADASRNVWVTGSTASADFPTTGGAYSGILLASIPPTPTATENVVYLGTLTPAEAIALDGQRVFFVVTLDADTAPDDEGGGLPVLRDCVPSGPSVFRSVVLPPGDHAGEVLVVEGVLRVTLHPAIRGLGGVEELPALVRVVAERVR
jgi:hypothetical protein